MFNCGFVQASSEGREVYSWYPTQAPEEPYKYGVGMRFHGSVTVAAPSEPVGVPLVFSAGENAQAFQYAWLLEALARRGWTVVATKHNDRNVTSPFHPQAWTSATAAERREDIKWLVTHLALERYIFVGHSLGGYVGLSMAGAQPSWQDERLTALVGYSAYNMPLNHLGSVAEVKVEVHLQGGSLDWGVTPTIRRIAPEMPNCELVIVPEANHFSWSNTVCGSLASETCTSGDVPRTILEATLNFLLRL